MLEKAQFGQKKRREPAQGADRRGYISRRRQKVLIISSDAAGAILSTAAAGLFWTRLQDQTLYAGHLAMLAILILLWVANFAGFRRMDSYLSRSFLDDSLYIARHVLVGSMLVALAVAVVARDLDPAGLAVIAAGLGAVAVPASRGIAYGLLGRREARTSRRFLVVGAGQIGQRVVRLLHRNPRLGCEVVGFLDNEPLALEDNEAPVLGSSYDLSEAIEEHAVDEVIFAFSTAPHHRILEMIWECDRHHVSVSIVPRFFETVTTQSVVENVSGLPILHLNRVKMSGFNAALKRGFDLAGAVSGIALLFPLLAAIALAVKLDSPGPVFFSQKRIGFDGRPFLMHKFRSMQYDAEEMGTWTQRQDPRRTRLGQVLRKYNLDELPQLLNVLKGEMSLVGPRPEQPRYVEEFEGSVYRYAHRHRVKSGITGWAQVSGLRGDTSIEERVLFDNHYIENWSLWMDVKVVILTLFKAGVSEPEKGSTPRG